MDILQLVKTRRSVRTFEPQPLSAEHRQQLDAYQKTIQNPYGIPVDFVLLDAKEHGLSSPVLSGETLYAAAKVERQPHAEEAFGYSFEKLVLYAWSLGIGTTWIGGTMKRELFARAAGVQPGQLMPCVSPLGYPAAKMSVRETLMRRGSKASERRAAEELFFDRDFDTPLHEENPDAALALELVRLAPSAVNRQPWRVVRDGNRYHFYLRHDKGYRSEAAGELQKVDMGIALCHFMSGVNGTFSLKDPWLKTEPNVEYMATVTI